MPEAPKDPSPLHSTLHVLLRRVDAAIPTPLARLVGDIGQFVLNFRYRPGELLPGLLERSRRRQRLEPPVDLLEPVPFVTPIFPKRTVYSIPWTVKSQVV